MEVEKSMTEPEYAGAVASGLRAFGPLKQIDAGVLTVGYAEAGPPGGPAVVLLHGWPYDIHSYLHVAPLLAAEGYRVIVPYLRGYGTMRFLSDETFRNGQQSVLAVDAIALMDALGVDRAIVGGLDWGARTASVIAALWPERCRALVSVSGYLIGNQEAGKLPLSPEAEREWWYQYYFATERGRIGYDKYRHEFAKLIWRTASPKWNFDDATFDRSAGAFDNPDHVAIAIHNYRWRLGLAEGEPEYDELERRLAEAPAITVPTITLEGDANGAPHPEPSAYASKFSGSYSHRTIEGGNRAQPFPGSPGSVCPGRHRCRPLLNRSSHARHNIERSPSYGSSRPRGVRRCFELERGRRTSAGGGAAGQSGGQPAARDRA